METTRKLTFKIGSEQQPKIETVDELESSLFSDVYKKAFVLIDEIINNPINKKSSNKRKNENKKEKKVQNNELNNVIAFLGERGAGKTSCMQTIHTILEEYDLKLEENNSDITKEIKKIKNVSFYSMGIIDPTYFEEESNILEIIISKMFREFKKHAEDPRRRSDCENSQQVEDKRKLIRSFQKVKDSLDKINNKSRKESNDSIDELVNMASSLELKDYLQVLVKQYLQYMKTGEEENDDVKSFLLISVDDIDIQAKYAGKMVEQIRKYFMMPNVIVMMAMKISQLGDIVRQDMYKDYETLMNKEEGHIQGIKEMGDRYLTKVLPYNHRLYLPDLITNLDLQIEITDEEGNIIEPKEENPILKRNFIIKNYVLELIYKKTRYFLYNTDGDINSIIPRNLRSLLNLISMLSKMEDIPEKEKVEINTPSIIYNKSLFKKYFIETWSRKNLSSEIYSFLSSLTQEDPKRINKIIIDKLVERFSNPPFNKDIQEYFNRNVIDKGNQYFNISLADVLHVLNIVDRYHGESTQIHKEVFAIKTYYTMFLYELYLDMNTEENKKLRANAFWYDIRNKYSVNLYSRYEKKTHQYTDSYSSTDYFGTLSKYSNYEKILNGSIIDINYRNYFLGRDYNMSYKISGKRLNLLFDAIGKKRNNWSGTTSITIDSKQFTLEYKRILNIWEFFILNTMSENEYNKDKGNNFRKKNNCFYDYLPFDLPDIVYFDTSSVFFNTIKYFNTYMFFKNSESRGNELLENVVQFYSFMVNNIEIEATSLLSKIYKDNLDIPPFIGNIQIIETLIDYLPLNNSIDDKFERIRLHYKKIKEFNTPLPYINPYGWHYKEVSFKPYSHMSDLLKDIFDEKGDSLDLFRCLFEEIKEAKPSIETPE